MAEDNFGPSIATDLALESSRRVGKTLKNYLWRKAKAQVKDFPEWRKYRKEKLKGMMQQRHYEHPRYWRKALQPLGAGFSN